jgi:hypothetical protein
MPKDLFHLHSGDKVTKVKAYDVSINVTENKLKAMAAKVGLRKATPKTIIETYIKHVL